MKNIDEPLVYIQTPAPKTRLYELINNPPMSVLMADSKAVRWLDELKREIEKLKK